MLRVVVNKPQPLDSETRTEQLRLQLLFGQHLRELRHVELMTIEQVAEVAGLHPNYLSSVERGERNVSLFNIWRIASGLDLTAADLMNGLPLREVKQIVMEPN